MDVEELIGKPNKKKNNSDHNSFIKNFGFIIFFFLSLFLIGASIHLELNVAFIFGKITSYCLIFFIIYLVLKYLVKTEYAINYSSILPIMALIAAFVQGYLEYVVKDNLEKINSFNKNLIKVESKWMNENLHDANIRSNFQKDVNNYIDSYMSSLGGESLKKIKKIKILKNEQFNLENKFFENLEKVKNINLLFLHKNLDVIDQFIDSTQNMLNLIDRRKNTQNYIRKEYELFKIYGLELKKIGEVYLSFLNNEKTELEKNKVVEEAMENLVKLEKDFLEVKKDSILTILPNN